MDTSKSRTRNKSIAKGAPSTYLSMFQCLSLIGSFRFLADRFVEGVCPHCGYEASCVLSISACITDKITQDARGDQCDLCSRTLDAIELIKPRCMVNKDHKVTTRTSTHNYLKLNEIQPRTEEWIKKSWKAGHWSPNSVINANGEIVDARVKAGLLPTPLTRDLKWGVKVPIDSEEDKAMEGKVLCKAYTVDIHVCH